VKFNLLNNSVVVVAGSHNPSVVSQAFLSKAGIVGDFALVDENSLIITPAISQIIFKNGTSLQLDPERLTLTSLTENSQAAELADKYCKTLPFIKGTAIGINFVYTVVEFDFASWFAKMARLEYEGAQLFSVDIRFPTDGINCNVKALMTAPNQATFTFNFHRDLLGIALGEIPFQMLEKQKSYLKTTKEFLAKLFQ
jgi:hypothetical protein